MWPSSIYFLQIQVRKVGGFDRIKVPAACSKQGYAKTLRPSPKQARLEAIPKTYDAHQHLELGGSSTDYHRSGTESNMLAKQFVSKNIAFILRPAPKRLALHFDAFRISAKSPTPLRGFA